MEHSELLEIYEHGPDFWEGGLVGPVHELLEWLQGRPVHDLVISPPDLDSLFLRYYRNDPGHEGSDEDRDAS